MIRWPYLAGIAGVTLLAGTSPARAGVLTINNTGLISDTAVLGAINSAVSNIESLYSTGNGAGDVTLNVNFTYSAAGSGNLASSQQYIGTYSYSAYTSALRADSLANPNNTYLATAVANLSKGNVGNVDVTYGQAMLLSQYGFLSVPTSGDTININSNVANWNFNGTTTSTQYDAIGAIEHELNELLGIGGGGSFLGLSTPVMGATDLYRYSSTGSPSLSTSNTHMSIDGGANPIVAFNGSSSGDYGDFAPSCGPSSGNTNNNQYIQNAFNCTGSDENYTTASPEYVAALAVGWNPVTSSVTSAPEPSSLALLGGALLGLVGLAPRRRRNSSAG